MKVIVDGKEVELIDNLEPGAIELDKLTEEDTKNSESTENTIELTEEMLDKIKEMEKDSYEEWKKNWRVFTIFC